MSIVDWSEEKNTLLKKERLVSFEQVLEAIENNKILDIILHPNTQKYPHQKILIVNINVYVYLVPYVENGTKIFLKTIIPNHKATQRYLNKTK